VDLLAALRAAGVENPALDQGRGALLVHGRFSIITRARVDAILQAASDYGKANPSMMITEVSFYGLAADCPAIEQRAREAALADARRRADAIAASGNSHLGDQVAVTEDGGCPRPGPFGLGSNFAMFPSLIRVPIARCFVA